MNINELDSASLSDYIKFHDELNPRLWDRDLNLKADVRQALLTIADDFREFLGINDLEIKDITVSGSNAGYNYHDHSDIDLHLVVDLPEADRNQVYRELFDAKKYQYNDLRDITIGGYDVELYVQNANEPHYSQGIYSVLNDHWNIVPKKIKTPINDDSVISKYQDLEHRINSAVKQDNINKIQDLIDKIKNMRATGLAQHGEFGVENLTFKLLRSQGIIKKLYDRRNQLRDQQLSLTERKKRRSRRVKYGYTGYWYPGYSWSGGSTESGGGDGGGGESVNESQSIGDHIKIFATEIMDELGITRRPKIILHHDPQWTIETGSFGQYNPETNHLQLSVVNRHILDIIRTLAHELVHCAQRHRGRFPDDAGETGSPYEDEANALAGRILRGFADRRPELFQDMELSESSGYIPTEKEKNDPRFSMALTTDVRPGETGRQANKLNLKTDTQGRPALLMRKKQLREGTESPMALRIYLDMDGVLANFAGRYREVFGVDPTPHSRDDPHISKILGTDFFRRLDKFPTTDAVVELAREFGGGRYNICSSPLRGDHANSSDNKKQWLLDNLQPLPSHIIFTRNKEKYATTNGQPNVLVDDKPSNIAKWRAAGGHGILYDAEKNSLDYLKNQLQKIVESTIDEDFDPNDRPPGPEFKPTMPKGTVKVNVSDVYDWYKLGQHISNLKGLGRHDFGQGPPSAIINFGNEDLEHQYLQALKKTGLDTTDIDPAGHKKIKGQKTDPTYNVAEAKSSGYKEIEFICANPEFCDATDPVKQQQLYKALTKIPGVIPLYQDQSEYSEGQMSLTAIYQDRPSRQKILALAKQLGVKVDLERPVSDDYVDRAIRGEHEGQQGVAEGSGFDQEAGIGIDGKSFKFKIRDLVALADNYPVTKINPQQFSKQIADRDEDSTQSMARAEKADLQYPIIVVKRQNGQLWIADGTHRAHKAILNKLPSISAKIIPIKDMAPFDVEQGVAEANNTKLKLSSTSPRAQEWIKKIYDKFPGTWQNYHVMSWGEGEAQQLAMFELVPSMSKRGAVDVKWFQAYPLRQGVGSKAMKVLQDMAREDGISLTLYPWDKGQISQAKLIKFYKSHGFKPTIKGSKNMVWEPVNEQGVAEGLSWSSLDKGLSLEDKMTIFEEYAINGLDAARNYLQKLIKQNMFDNGFESGSMAEAWSEKYKRSINCNRPKGFSQRAHCQGRKKK